MTRPPDSKTRTVIELDIRKEFRGKQTSLLKATLGTHTRTLQLVLKSYVFNNDIIKILCGKPWYNIIKNKSRY